MQNLLRKYYEKILLLDHINFREDYPSSNDYPRSCNANWRVTAYGSSLQQLTAAEQTQLLTQMNLSSGGESVLPEVQFFFGDSETGFFDSRDLPQPINQD